MKVCGKNGPDLSAHTEDFEPKKSSCLCSVHLDDSCFECKPVFHGGGSGEAVEMRKLLIKGSVPSKNPVFSNTSPITKRKRRSVREVYVYKHSMLCHHVRVSNTHTSMFSREQTTINIYFLIEKDMKYF